MIPELSFRQCPERWRLVPPFNPLGGLFAISFSNDWKNEHGHFQRVETSLHCRL